MNIDGIKGIGEKTKELFEKINIYDTKDLINYYPRNYDFFGKPVPIDTIDNEKVVSIIGKFHNRLVPASKGKVKITSGIFIDENGMKLQIVWYNMPYLAKTIFVDTVYILRGTLKRDKSGRIVKMFQPEVYTTEKYKEKLDSLQPIYSLTKGLTNNIVKKAVLESFRIHKDIVEFEYLPENIRNKKGLISEEAALHQIHFPKNEEEAVRARKRLSFDEFLLFILSLKRLKKTDNNIQNQFNVSMNKKTEEFIEKLPFTLTNAQKKVIREINIDMSSSKVMNRLIQGDVGSGKTIVAQIALMNTVYAGYQGGLMAPTEVLAKQHYDNFVECFEKYNIDINVVLLTGSMTVKEKKEAYYKIENGIADIIIGTHALIVDKVKYKKLGLVITDEQHRFGVAQRKNFFTKGENPHILVMSATPIPRTLAIILYGDLDISIIDELPSNRLPVKNCVVTTDYRPKAYDFIKKQIDLGHQVYIICPMVEESDNIEACDVISYAEQLREVFSEEYKIEYLHGKMKAKDKNSIMERFASGDVHILVSTTVIEVGVNVPNTTVMMVENSERFGLATLHQLRGRVGRGDSQSYCIFVSGSKNEEKLKRLKILNESNDGFYIASEDLKLRGPGDLFGIKQSGDLIFKIGDIYGDADMLKEASQVAKEIEENSNTFTPKDLELLNEKINKYTYEVLSRVNL